MLEHQSFACLGTQFREAQLDIGSGHAAALLAKAIENATQGPSHLGKHPIGKKCSSHRHPATSQLKPLRTLLISCGPLLPLWSLCCPAERGWLPCRKEAEFTTEIEPRPDSKAWGQGLP